MLVSVITDTVVGTDEKNCDLVLWACGVTEGCLIIKVREKQWKFMSYKIFSELGYLKIK